MGWIGGRNKRNHKAKFGSVKQLSFSFSYTRKKVIALESVHWLLWKHIPELKVDNLSIGSGSREVATKAALYAWKTLWKDYFFFPSCRKRKFHQPNSATGLPTVIPHRFTKLTSLRWSSVLWLPISIFSTIHFLLRCLVLYSSLSISIPLLYSFLLAVKGSKVCSYTVNFVGTTPIQHILSVKSKLHWGLLEGFTILPFLCHIYWIVHAETHPPFGFAYFIFCNAGLFVIKFV